MYTIQILHKPTNESYEILAKDTEELEIFLRRHNTWLNNEIPFGNLNKCLYRLTEIDEYTVNLPSELVDILPNLDLTKNCLTDLSEHAQLELKDLFKSEESDLKNLYGINATEFKDLGNNIKPPETPLVTPKIIVPYNMDGAEYARILRNAFTHQTVSHIHLKGKHSRGTFIATDPESGTKYLIKPGSGSLSPAKGISQVPYSQSKREAVFYQIAQYVGLGEYFPKCQLLLLDGAEVAIMEMLPPSYKTYAKFMESNQFLGKEGMKGYLDSGTIHKWAILDYILGNADRHSSNILLSRHMGSGGNGVTCRLIDHGSTLCGTDFDVNDSSTFVPFYLRVWTNPSGFKYKTPESKFHSLPTTSLEGLKILKEWFMSLDLGGLKYILEQYEIDPNPYVQRFNQIIALSQEFSLDITINKLWSGFI